MRSAFYDLASIGVVKDKPPHTLNKNVWSNVSNGSFADFKASNKQGSSFSVTQPSENPLKMTFINVTGTPFFVYGTATKLWCLSGTVHTDITRLAGASPYALSAERTWGFAEFGGLLIANNGNDTPQYWPQTSTGTDMANMTAWPASTKAKVIRAFKNFLVGYHITKGANDFPHMVKWSHPADPGTLPVSWDHTDATKDAGEYPLIETGDIIIDALSLRDLNLIYKERTTWSMQFIGGTNIFAFRKVFGNLGIIGQDCAVDLGDRHFVFTLDDLIIHDGLRVNSVADGKVLRHIYNELDTTNYKNSFCLHRKLTKEVMVFYPKTGSVYPNSCAVYNYVSGAWTFFSYNNQVSGGAEGYTGTLDTWSTDTGTWSTDTSVWDSGGFSALDKRLVLTCPVDSGLLTINVGTTDGRKSGATVTDNAFTTLFQRDAIVFAEERAPNLDNPQYVKQVTAVYPNIVMLTGATMQVSVGAAENPEGPYTYQTVNFTPSSSKKVDVNVSGRFFSVKFSGQESFTLNSYMMDVKIIGSC